MGFHVVDSNEMCEINAVSQHSEESWRPPSGQSSSMRLEPLPLDTEFGTQGILLDEDRFLALDSSGLARVYLSQSPPHIPTTGESSAKSNLDSWPSSYRRVC